MSTTVTAQQSAGDLLCAALDRWAQHSPTCELDRCGECDACFNQVRLAHKVWKSSAYKAVGFQSRVHEWVVECFGSDVASNRRERNHRFLEESLELVQALGCTEDDAHTLVDYVYGRPAGDAQQEVGGTLLTLAALCSAWGFDLNECGQRELTRVHGAIEKIRAKQAAKLADSALPGPSIDGPIPMGDPIGALVFVKCPACRPNEPAPPLPDDEVEQGEYGNCAVCFRQMRVVRDGAR